MPSLPFFFDVVSAPLLWSQTLPKPPTNTMPSFWHCLPCLVTSTSACSILMPLHSQLHLQWKKKKIGLSWIRTCACCIWSTVANPVVSVLGMASVYLRTFLSITLERKWNSKIWKVKVLVFFCSICWFLNHVCRMFWSWVELFTLH